ncbi:unnamed protein product [Larinioides sclopetarius]|uniref:Uncharacterized protein n=1 Tax=Larinioides sclopetarius TaxID=280406 RepID=A0AAV2BUG6_9ARAC
MFPSPHWLRPGRLTRSAGQTSQAPWASIQGVLMVTSLLSHPSGLQWLHFPNFSVSTRYSHRHQSSCCLAGDDFAAVMQISIDWQVVSCVLGPNQTTSQHTSSLTPGSFSTFSNRSPPEA